MSKTSATDDAASRERGHVEESARRESIRATQQAANDHVAMQREMHAANDTSGK